MNRDWTTASGLFPWVNFSADYFSWMIYTEKFSSKAVARLTATPTANSELLRVKMFFDGHY